ncbi:hypothetical protein D3C84_1226940 [compost metagenome]
MRFAISAAAWHPRLDVELFVRLLRHIACTDGHHFVRKLQQAQQLLGIRRNFLQQPPRHREISFAQDNLLDLGELVYTI